MSRGTLIGICLAAGAFGAAQAAAPDEGHSLSAKAGVLGLGVEYGYAFSDRLGLRVGLNGSEVGFEAAESGIEYDFDLVWDSVTVAVDFHPRRGPLRITGGVLSNDNRLQAVARTSNSYTIGGTTYTPEDIGSLSARVDFDDTAAFLGVGWDWSRKRERFGVSFDMGLVKQGGPRVSLRADGDIAGDPEFADDVAAEEAELRASLDDFDVLPFATLGLVFRF